MGSTAVRVALSLLVVASALAGTFGGTAVAQTSPEITVTVDGSTVADGDSTLVESDPTVGVTVETDRQISVVSVRVDGTTERQYTPNATTLDESFELDLRSGEHDLDVVVETDGVATHSTTVTKDAERPYVRYTSPFETGPYEPPPEDPTVNRSDVRLAGNFSDVTGVSSARFVRETTYRVGTTSRTDRKVYSVSDPGDAFEQPIFLGVGRNNVTASYTDELGHVRTHRMEITVEDTAPPALSNLAALRRSPSELRIRGTATDNGQIRSVTIRPEESSDSTYLADPASGEPDPERQRVDFGTNVTLYPGVTSVVVNATDTAGNSVERTVTVHRNVEPELALDPGETRFANESSVVANGTATDGEIVDATVETVDPASGEVIDIVSLHDGDIVTDLSFEHRLDAPDGRTVTVRLRVIDSSGTEHVTSLDRTLTVATPTASPTPAPTASPTPASVDSAVSETPARTATPTPAPDANASGLTVPVLGVTIPVPSVLGASFALPAPVVGPVNVPVVPVVAVAVVGVGVLGRAR